MSTRYYAQTQAPAGNWTDTLGSDRHADCIAQATWHVNRGTAARVVERVDVVVWSPRIVEEDAAALRASLLGQGKATRVVERFDRPGEPCSSCGLLSRPCLCD